MTYLIYDTALNGPYTFMLLQQAYPVYQSIFKGTKDEALSDVAPYLFEVDELLFEKITGPLVSSKAIIVVQSGESIEQLCLHFKNFIYQQMDGRENYFRFWDARVLDRFLPGWPKEKTADFFEDIQSFSFINEEENGVTQLTLPNDRLEKKLVPISELFGKTSTEKELVAGTDQNNNNNEGEPGKAPVEQKDKPKRRFFYE